MRLRRGSSNGSGTGLPGREPCRHAAHGVVQSGGWPSMPAPERVACSGWAGTGLPCAEPVIPWRGMPADRPALWEPVGGPRGACATLEGEAGQILKHIKACRVAGPRQRGGAGSQNRTGGGFHFAGLETAGTGSSETGFDGSGFSWRNSRAGGASRTPRRFPPASARSSAQRSGTPRCHTRAPAPAGRSAPATG